MEEKIHILIVEDDRSISNILKLQLEREGYLVSCAYNGLEGVKIVKEKKIDLVVLDWMLPQIGGIEVCKIIKSRKDLPVIFLTSRNRDENIIEGLESGGDDYITKPFKFAEVLARIRANLRKYRGSKRGVKEWRDLSIDIEGSTVYLEGEKIEVNRYEFYFLRILFENPNSITSRNTIIRRIWGDSEDEITKGNNLDVVVNSLRKKISPEERQKFIKTHRGLGYGFK